LGSFAFYLLLSGFYYSDLNGRPATNHIDACTLAHHIAKFREISTLVPSAHIDELCAALYDHDHATGHLSDVRLSATSL